MAESAARSKSQVSGIIEAYDTQTSPERVGVAEGLTPFRGFVGVLAA
jgi:hypothetical protein